jgi:hypothetical protein
MVLEDPLVNFLVGNITPIGISMAQFEEPPRQMAGESRAGNLGHT